MADSPTFKIRLQPKQELLLRKLEATGDNVPRILGTGGSRGSAKSGGLRRCAIALAMDRRWAPVVIYIVRRVLGDLLENHMEKIKLEFPEIHQFYRPSDYEYSLPNGSRIVYLYGETKADIERVSYGPECTFLFVDQAEQFTENELQQLRICNRWPSAPKGLPKSCYFFNAGVGIGAGYLRRVFWLRNFHKHENPGDHYFLQTYAWDNFEWFRKEVEIAEHKFYALSSEDRFQMFISSTTEGKKMDALPAHDRECQLLGNFEAFSGQYFSDVWGDHIVLEPGLIDRIVQDWWVAWMSQDWGFGDHTYHAWFVTGKLAPTKWKEYFGGETQWPIDIVILYREYLISGRAEGDLGTDIAKMTPLHERKHIREFFLSQDAFGQKSRQSGSENTVGQTFSAIMRRHGLPEPLPASQDRVNGHRFLYNCLRQAGLRGGNVDTERAKQGPALFISAECPAAIENIPLAVRDEDDPNDVMRVAGAVWEDVVDGIRYGTFSKLAPKRIAPVEVRAAEVSASAPTMQERHMRMLHFKEQESRKAIVRHAPRWR